MIRPLVAAFVHRPSPGWAISEYRGTGDVRLFISAKAAIPANPPEKPSHLLLRHALRLSGRPGEWRFVRLGSGQLLIEDAGTAVLPRFSLSASDDAVVVAVADTGAVGVDVETVARVSRNTSARDAWLSPDEQRDLAGLSDMRLGAELACRWTLKEALGKAAGVGLAMKLDALTTRSRDGHLVATASEPAERCIARSSLALFGIEGLIVAIAHRP